MNITQAKSAMKKLFGAKAMWRYDERAPKAEEREEIAATLPTLMEARNATKAAVEARRIELLKDPEYVRLKAEALAASDTYEKAASRTRHYRVTVGRGGGVAGLNFFHVVAQGDNWQDAIDKARAAATRGEA